MVRAIGGTPALVDPNRRPLDAAAAFLIQATAQSLVRFEPSGQIEPALAQRWIVSDDGLRYTFRLADVQWSGGGEVTAEQVVARIRAALARGSRNPLKQNLGVIDEAVAMTDDVVEISIRASRPHFLELLAQPELAIIRNGQGSGPFRAVAGPGGLILLSVPRDPAEEEADEDDRPPEVLLRGEASALAIARFMAGQADLVIGGTAGDLVVARAAQPRAEALRFDTVAGLFGIRFENARGILATPAGRAALSMAIDRAAIVATLAVPSLAPRTSLAPPGLDELPQPALPEWDGLPFVERRERAAAEIARLSPEGPPRLRVAVPDGPGYRMIFALLRRDWRMIGVEAEAVAAGEEADLQLIDRVAPATLASWYLRSFSCDASEVCSSEADTAMEEARRAGTSQERQEWLADADLLLRDTVAFIPLTAPVRWSLVGTRVTGFQPNVFARHAADRLVAERR